MNINTATANAFTTTPKVINFSQAAHLFIQTAPNSPPVQHQDGWRCCQKCRGLFYGDNPDQGDCPARGKHDSAASNDYMMPFGGSSPGMQPSWRWCRKCQGIFYAGGSTFGACPAGSQHDGTTSAAYDIYFQGPPGLETNWRWCAKCEGLFSLTNDKGVCPTGGQHDDNGSGSYGMRLGALPKSPVPKLKPQLFLVETYQLSTFRGDLIRGQKLTDLPAMDPGETKSYIVATKIKNQKEMDDSDTVVDGTSQQSADSFNQQLQGSSDAKSSSDHYDYGFEANAHAEGSVGFGTATGDASVNAAGSTNDARQEIAQSVAQAIDHQVSQASQARHDDTRVVQDKSEVDMQTETVSTVTRTNNSDQPLNLGVFEVRQELVTVLSLIDVQVAFRNTDPSSNKTANLFEIDSLLGDVIATIQDRKLIKDRLKAILENIRDHMDEARSILSQDPNRPDWMGINKNLMSSYQLKNDDGSTRRVLSVNGIILDTHRTVISNGTMVLKIV